MDAARVTVTDNGGATASASQTVTASPPANLPPVARLTVTPSSGTAPLAVRADASASSDPDGTIASYRFDFGDGTIVGPQSSATATHTYASGTWTARVTVTDNGGATASASQTVTASPPANLPPVARLTVTPSSGTAPLAVRADASASSDPDGTIASYRFDFGDGTVVGPQSGATATHTYAAGNWTARVTVTDDRGATASASQTVTVSTPNQPPVASLTALPSSGFSPLPAVASAVGSSDPDGSIVSYRFDFGDGTVVGPQSLPTAAHVYGAGTWVVRLTVTDNGGATGTASATVTVSGLLGPLGSAEPVAGSSPDAVAEAGPALIDRVIPNPVRSEALLAFATTRAGALSVQVFDAGGRRVRTLMDEAQAAPAPYVVRIDGRDERGVPLRGGIYWYRIRSAEGPRVGRFVITR